ncbi:MAG: GAF domain-containing protein [Anaerolineaceae bacterium]
MTEKKITKRDEVLVRLQTNPDVAGGRLIPALRTISERCLVALNIDRINIWKISPQDDIMQSVDAYDQSLKIHSSGEIISIHRYPTLMASLQSERFISADEVNEDHRLSEMSEDLWKPLNIASALIIPIRLKGKLDGMVRFEQSRVQHNWTAEEESFACQVSEIIAGIFLVQENNEKAAQLSAHEETISEITRLTHFHTMLTEAMHRIIELSGARSAMLFKNDTNRREIECLISINTPISLAGIVIKYGEGAAGNVAETGRSIRIQDYHLWSGRMSQVEEENAITSVLAVPVRSQGRIIGVIEVGHHDSTSNFTETHRRILEVFSHDIAVIMEQERLTDQISTQTDYYHTLEQLISTSSLAGRLEGYLESVLDLTLKKFVLFRGILRVEKTLAVHEMTEEDEIQINERLSADHTGFHMEIIVSDWRDYNGSYIALASLLSTMHIKGCMFVPIWNDSEYLGYLCVFSASPREWSEEEISLIRLIAKQVALTTEKIKGSDERELVTHNLARLNGITADLNRLFTFEDAVIRVGQGAVELMGADHAALFLKNPDGSLSVPWYFAIADTHFYKSVPAENRELVQLLLGSRKPITYHNFKSTPLPHLFKKYMSSSAIASAICLPLVYSDLTVGSVVTFHDFSRTLSKLESDVLEVFTNQAAVTLQNAWMYEQLDKGYTDLALSLARSIDTKESLPRNHTQKTASLAEDLGRKLGMGDQDIYELHWAAMLHDIGKSSVSDEILCKPGPLNEDERKLIEKLPEVGAEMIQPLSRFQAVGFIILNCREHFDGSGYPNGLKGDEIPLSARVLAVADAYSSITTDRPYHQARSEQEALKEIEAESGRQFDPEVVKVFLEKTRKVSTVRTRKAVAFRVDK